MTRMLRIVTVLAVLAAAVLLPAALAGHGNTEDEGAMARVAPAARQRSPATCRGRGSGRPDGFDVVPANAEVRPEARAS